MAETKRKTTNSNGSVLLDINKIAESVSQEDIQTLSTAIDNEIGSYKLSKEEQEQLQTIMNVDALEASKWKSVSDVLKYMSISALAENHPNAFRSTMSALLTIISTVCPSATPATGAALLLLAKVPDKLFTVLIKIGGFASPDYLIYKGVKKIASNKAEKAKAQAEDDANIDENMTNLIIVCKSKLLSAEMNRLINKEDDVDDDTIIGTKDGTVHTIIWNESAWEAFRDKLTSDDKVLIIGKIKNTMPLTAEQIRFEQFGVKYGWNNNIAMIEADPKILSSTKKYKEFLAEVNTLEISEKAKRNAKVKFDWLTAGKLAIFPPLLIGDLLLEDTAVKKQQLVFGLYKLYMQNLDEFLNEVES